MRKIPFFVFLTLGLFGCEQETPAPIDNNPNNNSTNQALHELLGHNQGLKIVQFIEDGVDKTNLFSSYNFMFYADGSVTATSGNQNIQGSFQIFWDDNQKELAMTFPNTGPLFELTDDWYHISTTTSQIKFEDAGDVIKFEKQ